MVLESISIRNHYFETSNIVCLRIGFYVLIETSVIKFHDHLIDIKHSLVTSVSTKQRVYFIRSATNTNGMCFFKPMLYAIVHNNVVIIF